MNTNDKTRESQLEKSKLLEKLYNENYNMLVKYVQGATRDKNNAEDIVQDTFYEAVRKADEVLNHENPSGWLVATAKYKMSTWKRKAANQEMLVDDDSELERPAEEEEYAMAEWNMLLEKESNVHDSKLFLMYYLDGLTAKEIAAKEDITESNFKVKMHRLRKKLLKVVELLSLCLAFMGFWGIK